MVSVPTIVTTSWDDGDPADLKIAEMLSSRGLNGTFYVPLTGYRGRPTLSPDALRSLVAQGLEIGGHGVSHKTLPTLSPESIQSEVRDSKKTLEDLLGTAVRMFCYPRGKYNGRVVREVKAAGYWGARTTRMLGTKLDFDLYEIPTGVQAYPHSAKTYLKNIAKSGDLRRLATYATRFRKTDSWVQLGKHLFDFVSQHGGVWHLYGHSWEIEELNLWGDLAELLDYVSGRSRALYINNTKMLQHCTKHVTPQLIPAAGALHETEDSSRP